MCEWCAVRISTALSWNSHTDTIICLANAKSGKFSQGETRRRVTAGKRLTLQNQTWWNLQFGFLLIIYASHCFEISIRLGFCAVSIMAEIGTKLISDCTKAAIIECWGASPLAGWSRPGAVFPLGRPQPVSRSFCWRLLSQSVSSRSAIDLRRLHSTFNYTAAPRLWLKFHQWREKFNFYSLVSTKRWKVDW